MDITLTTPALLFPTISLLLLAYTNRFLAMSALVRELYARHKADPKNHLLRGQIENLRYRLILIRNMQAFAACSLLLCVVCMFVLFAGWVTLGKIIFGVSLILMIVSLSISLREIQVSVIALGLQLSDMEQNED